MSKNWFITGTSRGFGRAFTEVALQRGDTVVATARTTGALDDLTVEHGERLVILPLDVTDRAAVHETVRIAVDRVGRLDIVVNNAGYGLFGAVEELSEADVRAQMETNFFGALWVTQAVIPVLREQGGGHIVQMSTIGGVAAFPSLGGYHASKWALEGMSESLAQEVAGMGIKVTLVEPGAFGTDWAGSSAAHAAELPPYTPLHEGMRQRAGANKGGDPAAAAQALLKIVDAEEPPLRVLFGAMTAKLVKGIYQQRLDTWAQWEQVSIEAEGV